MSTLPQVFHLLPLALALVLFLAFSVTRYIRLRQTHPERAEQRVWRRAMESALIWEIKTDPAPYAKRATLIRIYRDHVLSLDGEDRIEAMTELVRLAVEFPAALWQIPRVCDEKTTLEAARRIRREIEEAVSAEVPRPGAIYLLGFLNGTRKFANLTVDDYPR